MDRHLVGVLSICLVISTVITLFLVGEKSRGVTLVENQFPEAIYRSKEKGTFTFHQGIVSRQDFTSLIMEFYCLAKTQDNLTVAAQDFGVEVAIEMPRLSAIFGMARGLGFSPTVMSFDLDHDSASGTIKIIDFSPIFDTFAPQKVRQFVDGARGDLFTSPSATLAFAFLFDEGGKPLSCYEGTRDFFLDKDLTLDDLYVRRNDETRSYTSSRIAQQPDGRGLTDSPRGHLLFDGVRRDDRFEVGFSLNARWVPAGLATLQILHVTGDLEDSLWQANLVG